MNGDEVMNVSTLSHGRDSSTAVSGPTLTTAPTKNTPKRESFTVHTFQNPFNVHDSSTFTATPLRQQKLPAWQPALTAWTVIPAYLIVGMVFVLIGVVLINVSANVQEHVSARAVQPRTRRL
jgi:hypothetical protein